MMPNLFKIETRLIEVEAAKAALEELVDARPTPHNQPLTWAAKHLFKAVGALRQEVDDQTKTRSGRELRADRRPLDGVPLIGKQILGWGARIRARVAR